MKSPKKRIKFYLLLYCSFLVVEMMLVKYFNFEMEQVFPVIGIVSMFISFIILMFEILSLVKFIKDNYIKELEKIIPKRYNLHTSNWGMWFAFSSEDFGNEEVKKWKEQFRSIFGLNILYIFIILPISFFGPGIIEFIALLNK